MKRRRLLILVTGEPVPTVSLSRGGFSALIQQAAAGAWNGDWEAIDARSSEFLPDGRGFAGVLVTGSADSLTQRTAWMDRSLDYLQRLVQTAVPTLGICFGHQMLGEALGGRVAANPRGREIGSVPLQLLERAPFLDGSIGTPCVDSRTENATVMVNTTHLDSVVELPPGARVLAKTALEPHAFVQFGERAWGVQFHPEMDAAVVRAYIEHRRDAIEQEGLDVQQLWDSATDTPHGRSIIERFVRALD